MRMATAGTLHMSFDEFADGFANAAPGGIIVYAIGTVAGAKQDGFKDSPASAYELLKVSEAALRHQVNGRACLTQKRLAPDVFEYRCVKTVAGSIETERRIEPCEQPS